MRQQMSFGTQLIVCSQPVAAGTTPVKGTGVEMSDASGAEFFAHLGALTANHDTYLKLQHSNTDVDGDYVDIPNARTANAVDADANKTLRISIYKPRKRYVRAVLHRGTANAVLNGMYCNLDTVYKPSEPHSTQGRPTVYVNGDKVVE